MSSAESALHDPFSHWYSEHHGWLCAWLRKRLGCPHQAADVAQNTFLRVLLARDAMCDVQQPRAWLTTTARRLIVDEARHRKIEQAYLAELAALGHALDGHPSPEQILGAVQALAQLGAVLEAVSPRARAAFVHHYLEGDTHAVTAEALGVSVRMVQKYLVQVLLQCRGLGLGQPL